MVGQRHLKRAGMKTFPGWFPVTSRRMPHALSLLVASLVLLLGTFACAADSPRQVSVAISCEEFQQKPQQVKSVTAAPDDTITVTLCSNPSTGFQWEQAAISTPAVLSLSLHHYIQPQAATPIVGAAGQEQWQFDVRTRGTTSVDFHYSQPWAGGTKNVWSVVLTINVNS